MGFAVLRAVYTAVVEALTGVANGSIDTQTHTVLLGTTTVNGTVTRIGTEPTDRQISTGMCKWMSNTTISRGDKVYWEVLVTNAPYSTTIYHGVGLVGKELENIHDMPGISTGDRGFGWRLTEPKPRIAPSKAPQGTAIAGYNVNDLVGFAVDYDNDTSFRVSLYVDNVHHTTFIVPCQVGDKFRPQGTLGSFVSAYYGSSCHIMTGPTSYTPPVGYATLD